MSLPPQPWPTGRLEQVEPQVARILAPNASRFTYTGTQTYLVGGDDALAVIDPGPDEPDHLAALEAAIGGREVLAIACTHTHRDHSPAAAPLAARTGAPIIGCAPLALAKEAGEGAEEPFDRTYAPVRVLADGETIAGPSWTLEAVATPGHTSNHLCYALRGTGVLLTGDHVMGWSTTAISPPNGDMGAYMASLEKLQARGDRIFYPAHGAPVQRPAQLLRGLIGHRLQRERQILRLLAEQGRAVEQLVAPMYAGLDPALWPAAGKSVLAHLLDLERRGLVARSGGKWTTIA